MSKDMPQVLAEFGTTPTVTFPTATPPAGLKIVELVEGDGPCLLYTSPSPRDRG